MILVSVSKNHAYNCQVNKHKLVASPASLFLLYNENVIKLPISICYLLIQARTAKRHDHQKTRNAEKVGNIAVPEKQNKYYWRLKVLEATRLRLKDIHAVLDIFQKLLQIKCKLNPVDSHANFN